VAREIIEAHGGRIGFSSTEDEGSTVWVELPAGGEKPYRGARPFRREASYGTIASPSDGCSAAHAPAGVPVHARSRRGRGAAIARRRRGRCVRADYRGRSGVVEAVARGYRPELRARAARSSEAPRGCPVARSAVDGAVGRRRSPRGAASVEPRAVADCPGEPAGRRARVLGNGLSVV